MIDRLNSALRWVPTSAIYIMCALLAAWPVYLALTGGLGVEPIKALKHELGLLALQTIVLILAVTPLRRYTGLNLIRFRRALGIMAFVYVVLHLLVWLVLDVQIPQQIWADILKRPYITIGMAAFVLMIPLAVTSNDHFVRRLGPLWRKLHKATYVVALLGGLHFVMLRKGLQLEPLLYCAAIMVLLLLRWRPVRKTSAARTRSA